MEKPAGVLLHLREASVDNLMSGKRLDDPSGNHMIGNKTSGFTLETRGISR
jgi:hypothetical protein